MRQPGGFQLLEEHLDRITLEQKILSPMGNALLHDFNRILRCEHNDERLWMAGNDAFEGLYAIHFGHAQIGQH